MFSCLSRISSLFLFASSAHFCSWSKILCNLFWLLVLLFLAKINFGVTTLASNIVFSSRSSTSKLTVSAESFFMFPFSGPCAHTLKSSNFPTILGNLIVPVTLFTGISESVEINCQ